MHVKHRTNRKNIFAKTLSFSSSYVAPSFPKSLEDTQFLDDSLAGNFVFATLSPEERGKFVSAMEMQEVEDGTVVIQQGDIGDYFYVIAEGSISISIDGNHVGAWTRGASFGELALLYDSPRKATCKASEDCKLWRVDQKTFRYMLASNTANQEKDVLGILRKVSFLADLEKDVLVRMADALTHVSYKEGERIISKGSSGEVFYILREGTVKVHDIGHGDSQYRDQFLKPGDHFGERALLTGQPRAANCTAETACDVLCLSRKTFENILGPLQDLIDHTMKKRLLMGIPLFADSKFESHEMSKITNSIEEVQYEAGTLIMEEGMPVVRHLNHIRMGKVVVIDENDKIHELGPGDYFGDRALKLDKNELSKRTIRVKERTVCGRLTREAIEGVIGDIQRLGKPLPPVSSKLDHTIKLDQLKKHRILGVGTFGKVWLVSHKKSTKAFALKMLGKREIIENHQVENVTREKNIMSSLDHPFVINLVCTFQDEMSLYMVVELVQAGELFTVVHTETGDGIPNDSACFYAACMLEALSHLHHRHLCYRDLKPENTLIDAKGYGVLVDLGFAKIDLEKTYTLCGTSEYLAPEIILSKGHDKGVDYWAFGVLIYEMLVGSTPFYDMDEAGIFKRIVKGRFTYPDNICSPEAEDIINNLIARRQAKRLGCLKGADQDIRDHKWFAGINTKDLLEKKIEAPWVPDLKDPLDASHFESYEDIENEPPSTYVLSDEQQEVFKDF